MTTESGRCLVCGHERLPHRRSPFSGHTKPWIDGGCTEHGCTCPKFEPTGGGEHGRHQVTAPATDAPTAVAGPTLCRCSFSTLPGKELVCAEAAGHPGPHHVDGVTWTQLFPDPRPALSYGCTCPGGDQHDPANPTCRYGQVAAVRPVRCRCGHDLDAHTGSFATGQHCKACPASQPCAGWTPNAYTPQPVNAAPVALAAARGALERAKRLERQLHAANEEIAKLRSALFRADPRHKEAVRQALEDLPVAPSEDVEADHG